jgi:hypothetical protein
VVEEVPQLTILGTVLDKELTLRQQKQAVVNTLRRSGEALAATMADLGFGLPVACAQYQSRVMGKALAGVEVLASAPEGFLAVMKTLMRRNTSWPKRC